MFEFEFICFALVLAILAIVKILINVAKIKFTSFDRLQIVSLFLSTFLLKFLVNTAKKLFDLAIYSSFMSTE
jgi:hypothetical protein